MYGILLVMGQDIEEKLIIAAQEGIKNALTAEGSLLDFRIGAAVLTAK